MQLEKKRQNTYMFKWEREGIAMQAVGQNGREESSKKEEEEESEESFHSDSHFHSSKSESEVISESERASS